MSKRPPKEKQPSEKPASRIAVGESRSPKKKQADIFARLILPPHPFEDLPSREEVLNVVPFGYPKEDESDVQKSENAQNLDIKNLNSTEDLDIQSSVQAASHRAENQSDVASRIESSVAIQKHENRENAAIQNTENAASNIATSPEWLATETDAVASKIATDKNAASHKSQKPRDWKKVALNRKKASVFVRANV